MTPDATPREALYIETGMLDIEAQMDMKRINMLSRLKRESSHLMDQVLSRPGCKWMEKTREILRKYDIFEWELAGMEEDKRLIKYTISERIRRKFKERMSLAEGRSKLTHLLEGKNDWNPEEPANYMNKLTRKQASTIFKVRTRMIKVKNNYRNGFTDLNCRACKLTIETQNHALVQCKVLHPNGEPKEYEMNPFSENLNILKTTAKFVDRIMEEISNGSTGEIFTPARVE